MRTLRNLAKVDKSYEEVYEDIDKWELRRVKLEFENWGIFCRLD